MREVQRDLQAISDDVARLAQQVTTGLSSASSDAVAEVKVQLNRIRDGLQDVIAEAGGKGMDTVKQTTDTVLGALEDSVRQRPIATLGIALGLGFLFGATWRR
jgi:ElaB/YqjD/DUF883 family membrane-anchored ribosome-binding protein